MGLSLLTILYIIGAIQIVYTIYRLLSFIGIYIHSSSLGKYLTRDAYALVTGATDGIGKGIVLELAKKGFNLILHGRNEEKLNVVKNEILAINPNLNIVCIVQDGSRDNELDISAIKTLPITVLVNNVGMGPIRELEYFSKMEIEQTINLNILFPTHLTNALLPYLSKPSLLLNVSSYAGLYPPPYLAIYAGTKAYNNAFSKSLSVELENIESISLLTGSVNTGSNQKPVSFLRPSSETYAKHVLSIVGCGKKSVMPYCPHAVQTYLTSLLPEAMIDKAMRNAMLKELSMS
jgi:17beta-estradiol 17-dehydrogenase / very-long-chain 3-oxoacyl-CoA reductase